MPSETAATEPGLAFGSPERSSAARGATNGAEIAAQLVVGAGAVEKHVSNIFSKLGVPNRTQAVARGRDLGLL